MTTKQPPKTTRLHPHVLEVVAEKIFLACYTANQFYSDPVDIHFLKMMLISKRCSMAFVHALRRNFTVDMYKEGGSLDFKEGAPLRTSDAYYHMKSKWLAFWMLVKGLFKWVDINISVGLPFTHPEMAHNESALESYARLIFHDDDEFQLLNMKSLDKKMKLPPVDSICFTTTTSSNFIVSGVTINRMFNLKPTTVRFCSRSNELDFNDSSLDQQILASATKSVIYDVSYAVSDSSEDDFAWVDRLPPWKELLIHTCIIAPNLEQLTLEIPRVPFYSDLAMNFDKLDEFLEELEPLIDWALDELLPEMSDDCCFTLQLGNWLYWNEEFGDVDPETMKTRLLDRFKVFAHQQNFEVGEEGDSEYDEDYELMLHSIEDARFEILWNFDCRGI